MNIASVLGLLYAGSELGLTVFKRAKGNSDDQGSLALLWIVISVSVVAAYNLAYLAPSWNFSQSLALLAAPAGVVLFLLALALRWYAIVYLGRYFTVNVAIAADHKLIDTGPYRYVRHPSYTGALLAFVGLGLCMANGLSLACLLIPVFTVFLRRMAVEEAALTRGLGEVYVSYMRRTKRLLPGLY
jgi:protein-S-isoprenylcysteine O-methyltransferase